MAVFVNDDGTAYDFVLEEIKRLTSTAECGADRRQALDWLRQHIEGFDTGYQGRCDDDECFAVERWLNWASSHRFLRIVSIDIPDAVLPPGTTGRLKDCKVFSKGGPDDAIYDADGELRDRVARGNCFLELSSGGETKTHCVIHALKKFTGGLGDDDDRTSGDSFTWKKYFRKPMEKAKIVVCTPKMNGEAAHLGVWRIEDEYYLCAGSKNVHLLFRNREDLNCYKLNESRYGIASEVCFCILAMLERLPAVLRNRLLEYLADSRSMAVFEMLSPDHPHVEDLSSLDANTVKFIAWTSCSLLDADESPGQLCYLPPDAGIELAKIFRLDAIGYDVINVEDVDLRMSNIRNQHGVEGEVLFFLDDEHLTFGMLKKKSIWYIMVRAIREKLRAACSSKAKNEAKFSVSLMESKLRKRVNELQKWLQFDDTTKKAWEKLALEFSSWYLTKMDEGVVTRDTINNAYPVWWKNFLKDTGNSDFIPVSVVHS